VKKLIARIWVSLLVLFLVYCFGTAFYHSVEFRFVLGIAAFAAFSCWAIVEASE
jgi:hypothetical protein